MGENIMNIVNTSNNNITKDTNAVSASNNSITDKTTDDIQNKNTSTANKPIKKKNKKLIIGITIAAIVLCIVGVIVTIFIINSTKPIDWTEDVNFNDFWVTRRDLEVAKQMNAPEKAMQSMERGQWLYPSDRESVRYAEVAIKHMIEAHGQMTKAQNRASAPWILQSYSEVALVVVGGQYDGKIVTVKVENNKEHTCTDNWYAITHIDEQKEFEETVVEMANNAFSNLPQDSWAIKASFRLTNIESDIPDNTPFSEVIALGNTDMYIYFTSSAIPDESTLEDLRTRLIQEYNEKGYNVYVWLCVVPDTPEDTTISVEYGQEQAENGHLIMTTSGITTNHNK